MKNKLESNITGNQKNDDKDNIHPWRSCGLGKHWVKTHQMHVAPTAKHSGSFTTRHGHCAENPGHVKDMLSTDEIHEIANKYFANLSGPPVAGVLTKRIGNKPTEEDFPKADNYDDLIRGWVHYWNDIFKPIVPLDPNLIKALMASESSFREKTITKCNNSKRKPDHAIGLLQITEETWHALNDYAHSELRNQFIHTAEQNLAEHGLMDPCINICSSVRWLFQKRNILVSMRLRRAKKDPSKPYQEPTWEETIKGYKGYRTYNAQGYQTFLKLYNRLKQG